MGQCGAYHAGRSGRGVDGTGDSVDTLRPDAHAASLVDVDVAGLWERGVRGIVLDLDNTCCAYHQPELAAGRRRLGRRRARPRLPDRDALE